LDIKAAIAQLSELQQTYPGAEIYLNGELTVDFPEDVQIPVEPNQMITAELIESSLKLNFCELDRAIRLRLSLGNALLRGQYAVVTVKIRIVQPKPFN
jgi:inner membrane protein